MPLVILESCMIAGWTSATDFVFLVMKCMQDFRINNVKAVLKGVPFFRFILKHLRRLNKIFHERSRFLKQIETEKQYPFWCKFSLREASFLEENSQQLLERAKSKLLRPWALSWQTFRSENPAAVAFAWKPELNARGRFSHLAI